MIKSMMCFEAYESPLEKKIFFNLEVKGHQKRVAVLETPKIIISAIENKFVTKQFL